jgi:hypothetical protein
MVNCIAITKENYENQSGLYDNIESRDHKGCEDLQRSHNNKIVKVQSNP